MPVADQTAVLWLLNISTEMAGGYKLCSGAGCFNRKEPQLSFPASVFWIFPSVVPSRILYIPDAVDDHVQIKRCSAVAT